MEMRRISKRLIVFFIILSIVALAIIKVRQKKEELARLKPVPVFPLPVEVADVRMGSLPVTEHYLGEIRPVLSARISSRVTGYLLEMNKYEGDRIKKGEIIAKIDPRQIRDRIRAIKADIEGAKSDMLTKKHICKRDWVLYKNKAMSKEEYEVSKAAYDLALSRLKRLEYELSSAETDLSYALIKAPFDGVVLKRLHEPGDLITPGVPIVEIEAPAQGYRIIVRVPQASISKLSPDNPAYLVEGKQRIKARIYSLHPAVETGTLGAVEIRTKERPFGLPTYGRVGVDLVVSMPYGAIVPLRSLLENVNASYVFVARPIKTTKKGLARVHIVPVEVLGRSGELIVVRSKEGLKSGDKVICADESILLRLHEGQKVYPEVAYR